MNTVDTQERQSITEPGCNAGLRLFPTCDPRGVLTRALASDAPPWSTRPDALVFGWMLALPVGVESQAAARGVLACVAADTRDTWTEDQQALLDALAAVADGRPKHSIKRRKQRR